jgi:ABC-type bacteriocin/lantibiotic exporter with double-glycine peptidase domain
MVLSSFGLDIAEEPLRIRCDCNVFGTDALKTVDAARQLGFNGTAKHTLSLPEIERLLSSGQYPIVLVDLRPIDGVRGTHAMVIVGVTASAVNVYDPARGERFLSRRSFVAAWTLQNNLAIIVQE